VSSLDVDSAIGAHRAWKGRLEHVIIGIAEDSIDLNKVGDDTRCLVGLWLFGSGQKYSEWEHFSELVEVHKQFHSTACQIVSHFHDGETEQATLLLEGDFTRLSNDVVALLTQLRNHLNAVHLKDSAQPVSD
jgi:hypothetical protein